MKKHHLKLHPSEQAVLTASAQILSAFIAAGQYQPAQEKELVERSLKLALTLAERVEEAVVAEEEIPE